MKLVKKIDQKQLIEQNLTSLDIFRHYIGDAPLGRAFHSPLRTDKNPSGSLYVAKNQEVRFKDHASGQNLSAIGYVQELYNLGYAQALDKICSDFGLLDIDFKAQIVKKDYQKEEIVKKKPLIQIVPKAFSEADLEYFREYGIEKLETLKTFNVYSVSKLYLNKQEIILKKTERCFAYFNPKSNNLKIMRPDAPKKNKWLCNTNNNEDILGYWQCNPKVTKPKLVLLGKAVKDSMFFWERGIYSMSINGENHSFNKLFIEHLKRHCKVILSAFDQDEAGFIATEKLEREEGIKPLIMPKFTCENKIIKDWTDAYKYCNKEEVNEEVQKIYKNYLL